MPQLDLVTFLSQYIWLVVIYLGFYLALVHTFLPKMARILKVRAALLHTGAAESEGALTTLQTARDHTAVATLKGAKSALSQGFGTLGSWVTTTKAGLKDQKSTEAYTTLVQDNARLQALIHKDVQTLLPVQAYGNLETASVHDARAHGFHTKTLAAVAKAKRS